MAISKPVPYPNLMDTVTSAVDAYTAVHEGVREHAAEHSSTLEQRRTVLAMKKAANKLIAADATKTTDKTG